MTWADALDRFGTDKPDLRFEMELVDLTKEFEATEVRAFSASHVKALRVPGGATFSRKRLDELTEQAKRAGAGGLAWFRVTASEAADGDGAGRGSSSGSSSGSLALDSPLDRFLSEAERAVILEKTGAAEGDLILAVADTHRVASTVLGTLRAAIGSPPVGQGPHRYVWVVDFPMFDGVDGEGNPQPAHHPFTMPYPEDMHLLDTVPFAVRSQAYDLVLNGWELGSGSVRIHRRDIQSRIFDTLGISSEEAEARFGFLLSAFRYGAPPHAGFAFGIDRLSAVLAGEENIREVIAYPKTQSGADLLTGAPAALPSAALAELGIRVVVPPPQSPTT
jgi:aspartyl-tRNA synthetase